MSVPKLSLFSIGARSSHHVLGVPEDVYVCPLCLVGFRREALGLGILTYEHVPPESQGGKRILLTCKPCNNTTGHTIDSAVADRERVIASMPVLTGRPSGNPIHGRATVGSSTVNVVISSTDQAIHINVPQNQNDPSAIQAYFRNFEQLGQKDSPQVELSLRRGYRGARALAGDLKSAYLAAFCAFGYAFILQPGMDLVRRQIREPDNEIIPRWWRTNRFHNHDRTWLGLTDSPFLSVVVGLRRTVVLLPYGREAGAFYQDVEAHKRHLEAGPIPGLAVPWPSTMDMRLDFLEGAWSRRNIGDSVV